MRRAARIDSTHQGIVLALRQVGAHVVSLASVGNGCPDLLAGFRGRNFLLECKSARGRLRVAQSAFLDSWPGAVYVVRGPLEALKAIGAIE